MIAIKSAGTRSMLMIAGAAVATLALGACNFTWTIFGMLDNPNDPRSMEYVDYTVEIIAGIGAGAIPDNGPASGLQFSSIGGITASGGYLYVADTMHNRVIRINESTKDSATIAGTGVPGYSGDGGPATVAELFQPVAVAVGADGLVYVQDGANAAIRSIDAAGTIRTYADLKALTGGYNDQYIGSYIDNRGGLSWIDGQLLVLHQGRILKIDSSSGSPTAAEYPFDKFKESLDIYINAMAMASDGRLWLSYYDNPTSSYRISSIGRGETTLAGDFGLTASSGTYIALRADDALLFVNSDMKLVAFDVATNGKTEIAAVSNTDARFCANASGQAYWTKAENGEMTIRLGATATAFAGATSKTSASASANNYVHPYDLAFDAGGSKLYFTESAEGSIRRLELAPSPRQLILMENETTRDYYVYGIAAMKDAAGAYYSRSDGIRSVWDAAPSASLSSQLVGECYLAMGSDSVLYAAGSSYNNGASSLSYGVWKVTGPSQGQIAGNANQLSASNYIDPEGKTPTSFPFSNMGGIAFSSDGGTLFTVETMGRILAIKGGIARRYAGGVFRTTAYGFDFGYFDPYIQEFGKATNAGLASPKDVAYGSDGSLYISGYSKLLKVNPEGLLEWLRFDIGGRTIDIGSNHGIAVDAAKCLYIPAGYHIIKATPRR